MGLVFPSSGGSSFSLRLDEAKKLLDSTDGMQANEVPDWVQFPQRVPDRFGGNEWGVGFAEDFTFTSAVGGPKDGALSLAEKNMALHQLAYDKLPEARSWNDTAVNATPISQEKIQQASNFLGQIFWNNDARNPDTKQLIHRQGDIRGGLDVVNDQQFTEADLTVIAALDGDASNVTSTDFDIAAMGGNPSGIFNTFG
ncbi:MAG: hypothetical protein AB7P76_12135 [Candidatus Melainabacteria bacterium]